MKLFEYEGKQIFREYALNVPNGQVCCTPDEVRACFAKMGAGVLKSQVLQGGRGKAGGIRFPHNAEEAYRLSAELFDQGLKQEPVRRLLVEEKVNIGKEFYLSISFDPRRGLPIIMASAAGGVDIEEVSRNQPSMLIREYVDLFLGCSPFLARKIAFALVPDSELAAKVAQLISTLYQIFVDYDAELVEINPLVVTKENELIVLDSKIIINDNAVFRQKEFTNNPDRFSHAFEYQAAEYGFNYVKLDGDIGVLCTGAGLTMTTLDLIDYYGGKAANFLEFGGATYQNSHKALNLVLNDSAVKVVLINTFGLVARADVISVGLVEALTELKPSVPIICSIRGTGQEAARENMAQLGLHPCRNVEEAVQRAVAIAKGKGAGA